MRTYMRPDSLRIELPTIMEVMCETYDDLETALEDEDIIR